MSSDLTTAKGIGVESCLQSRTALKFVWVKAEKVSKITIIDRSGFDILYLLIIDQ
jgi:hypothetical protein